jgi:hypothetical protein
VRMSRLSVVKMGMMIRGEVGLACVGWSDWAGGDGVEVIDAWREPGNDSKPIKSAVELAIEILSLLPEASKRITYWLSSAKLLLFPTEPREAFFVDPRWLVNSWFVARALVGSIPPIPSSVIGSEGASEAELGEGDTEVMLERGKGWKAGRRKDGMEWIWCGWQEGAKEEEEGGRG